MLPSGIIFKKNEKGCILKTSDIFQETRRSQPAAYRATTEDIDYLENQCADEQTNSRCDYQEYPGQDLGFGDLQLTATDKDEVYMIILALELKLLK